MNHLLNKFETRPVQQPAGCPTCRSVKREHRNGPTNTANPQFWKKTAESTYECSDPWHVQQPATEPERKKLDKFYREWISGPCVPGDEWTPELVKQFALDWAALALRDVLQGQRSKDLEDLKLLVIKRFGTVRVGNSPEEVGAPSVMELVYKAYELGAARQVPVGPEGKK